MGRRAPWSEEEVANLRAYQECDRVHPLTCADHGDVVLEITADGMRCPRPDCDYEQDWVPTALTRSDFLPQTPAESREQQ